MGFLLTVASVVTCAHAGLAQPLNPSPRVRAGDAGVLTLSSTYTVTGCSLSGSGSAPCATAQFIVGAARVRVSGVPVQTTGGTSTAVPTANPLTVVSTQQRVRGQ